MRRILAGLVAFLALTATLLVLPVYAAPAPEAEPVETASTTIDMGSVSAPAPEADTQDGTTEPVAGVPDNEPTLTVSRTDADPFSLVGVTWDLDPAVTDTLVQVRVTGADGSWGSWTEVTVEDADQDDDTDSGLAVRGGTSPLWTGPSTGVEVELVTRSGAQPTGVSVDLVDPGTSAADGSLGAADIQDTADAALSMPDVYSRAQWGADESIRTWDPEYAPTIRAATLHHTADTNDYTAAQVPAMMRSIYRYHAVSRGWGDIGYNVIVDKYGRLWEGRQGGLASTVVGAHAGGFNSGTFGVSMLGNYDLVQPPQVMVDAVAAIISWKFSLYGVDPNGTVTLTSGGGGTSRYAAGVRVTLPTIFGHRDVGSTTCPGQYGYAKLGGIRSAVVARLATDIRLDSPGVLYRTDNQSGPASASTTRGQAGDRAIACDWDGDGRATLAVVRSGRWIIFDDAAPSAAAVADFRFGNATDVPICGDWDGDGRETAGVWRDGAIYLTNRFATGVSDGVVVTGVQSGTPLVGDWDGDGYDTVAVRQGDRFVISNSNFTFAGASRAVYGLGSDVPVAGDWNADGYDTFGVFRGGRFLLSNSNITMVTHVVVSYGSTTDRPLVATWSRSGATTVGVARGY